MGAADRRLAVVTRAASGIGRAVAGLLLAEGAQVLAVDIDEGGLGLLVGDPRGPGRHDAIRALTQRPADG